MLQLRLSARHTAEHEQPERDNQDGDNDTNPDASLEDACHGSAGWSKDNEQEREYESKRPRYGHPDPPRAHLAEVEPIPPGGAGEARAANPISPIDFVATGP